LRRFSADLSADRNAPGAAGKDIDMRHRGMLVCLMLAAIGLAGGVCVAQDANQPAGGPQLAPVKTDQGDSPAPAAAPAAPTAGQATTTPATQPAGAGPTKRVKQSFFEQWGYMIILLGGFVLLYVWMGRSRRKQETKRKSMLSTLKKGDKVTTIGGIVGTVIEARPDELTVKVDETNNVRMKFARWAVRDVGDQARQEPENK
jgi:preprotein translocase subunit YajC